MKQNKLLILIFLLPALAIGQKKTNGREQLENEVMVYKRLFNYADSLPIRGKIGQVSNAVMATAKALDKSRPIAYFEKAVELVDKGDYNGASFLYHLGNLRFRYYNSSNPKYEPSGDGALLASFNYVLGEPLGYYLRSNADNFIEILKKCKSYYLANDYEFYSKEKDPVKYSEQADKMNKVITDVETNKATYQETWNSQRQEFTKNMDDLLAEGKKK